ncbi:NnrS family protein, partial [Methylacidimicrobium cyclopophantes]|uniref:NnrS family protein n=1 Tax=Methylacidimicrobium cyclopophantes TaxID=1041766 RepID=UPI001158FFF8
MEAKGKNQGTEPLPWGEWIGLCAQEPYRMLFPLGVLLGGLGVAIWPLFFFWGLAWAPPPISHPRIVIEGFVGSFVIGFLGTSVPRLLEVKRFSIWETGGVAAALSAVGLLHLFGLTGWGDGLFGSAILCFLWLLASRFPARRDNPPPSFLLALFGLLGAVVGSLWIASEEGGLRFSPFLHSLSLLLLYQGLPLLPILGVGAFLLPRFYGLPSRESLPEARIPTRAWLLRALAALIAALVLFASFLWEAAGGALAG